MRAKHPAMSDLPEWDRELHIRRGVIMSHEILSIIPAKGTSRGLPGKNLRLLCDKPLVQWTIEASMCSGHVTRTVVSSDSHEILGLARELGACVIERPADYSTDEASSESVMIHALECLEHREGYRPQAVVLLQPTSPLRAAGHIDGALELYIGGQCTAVISGYELERSPLKEFLLSDQGTLTAILDDRFPFMPRQQLPRAFRPNGAIYVVHADTFQHTGSLLTDRTLPFYMDEKVSIDIDTPEDLAAAEECLMQVAVES